MNYKITEKMTKLFFKYTPQKKIQKTFNKKS